MEERITDLEIRFMHQERTIHELSNTVYRQQQVIERLERELQQLIAQVRMEFPSLTRPVEEEEPPPHY
jgi:SlyX protein